MHYSNKHCNQGVSNLNDLIFLIIIVTPKLYSILITMFMHVAVNILLTIFLTMVHPYFRYLWLTWHFMKFMALTVYFSLFNKNIATNVFKLYFNNSTKEHM